MLLIRKPPMLRVELFKKKKFTNAMLFKHDINLHVINLTNIF